MKNKRTLLFSIVFLSALSLILFHIGNKVDSAKTLPIINKTHQEIDNRMETTPFVWEGKLKYLVTDRQNDPATSRLRVVDFLSREESDFFGVKLGLASALVHNGILHIFGTSSWTTPDNSIYLTQSKDLQTYTEPQKTIRAGIGKKIFNTSIANDGANFIMAYEVDEPGLRPFSIRFLSSKDLKKWHPVGSIYGEHKYAACPTIRKIDDFYYLWYLSEEGRKKPFRYYTRIARSKDLQNWEESRYVFLKPDKLEENNNSDVDLVEFEGKTYIFYAIGDQQTHAGVTYALFDGNIRQLVGQYF